MPPGVKGFVKGWAAPSGPQHYRFKDGRKKPCLTCGTIITAPYLRNCRSCFRKSLRGKVKPGFQNTGRTRFKKGLVPWNKSAIPRAERRRIAEHNRRISGGILLTRSTVQRVYEENIKQHGTLRCAYCQIAIPFGEDNLEHKIPLSRGGTHAYENLTISCRVCNARKRQRTADEFLSSRR